MNEGLNKLDEALHIGELELSCLQDGDLEKAEEYASQRISLIREAGAYYDKAIADKFKAKLVDMRNLQLMLSDEAKKLHSTLQREMKKGKEKVSLHRGYSKTLTSGSGIIPMYLDQTS